MSHPHRADPQPSARRDPSAGSQVSTAELGGSCGRQRRCLRIDFSSSCRDRSVTHACQDTGTHHSAFDPVSPHLVRAPGHLPSPSQRQCSGWRPRESRLHPESSQVPRPPHILSGNLTPPLEFREQFSSKGTWAGLTSPHIPQTPGPAPPFWGCPQPLTISTAIRNIAGGGLDPGHDLCQVSEPRAGEGQHL